MKALLALSLLFATPCYAAAPALDIRSIIWFVVVLIGVGIILGLLSYMIDKAPFIIEPYKAWGKYFLIVVACILIIYKILEFIGI